MNATRAFIFSTAFSLPFILQNQAQAESDALKVPDVVIYSTSPETHSSKTDKSSAPVTHISRRQIVRSGAKSVGDVLRTLPGLQLQDLNGTGTQEVVSLRGFGDNAAQNSLILIDGVPLANPDMGTPELNAIPLEAIERIEVIQGSQGVLYGNQAVGGVVNIITRTPEQTSAGIQTGFGRYEGKYFSGYQAGTWQKQWHYFIDGRWLTSNNDRDHNRNNEGFIFGKVQYDYSSGDLAITYNFHHQYLLYAGALTPAQEAENPKQAQNDTDFGIQDEHFVHLQQKQTLTPHWQAVTDLSERYEQGNIFLGGQGFAQQRQVFLAEPKWIGTWDSLVLTTGVVASLDEYALKNIQPPETASELENDVYGQAQIKLSPKWTLDLGGRYAQNRNDLQAEPGLSNENRVSVMTTGLRYQWTPELQWYVRRDGNFRFPKADEDLFTPTNVHGLQAQTGVSYETGILFQQAKWQANLQLFELDLKNEISFDPTQLAVQPWGANRNLDPTRRRGAMLANDYTMTKKWRFGWAYTRLDPRFRSGLYQGNQIPFVAKNSFQIHQNYQILPDWNFYSEAVYTGSRYPYNDVSNQGPKLSPVILINLSSRYRIQSWYLEVRINNLTNHFYNAMSTVSYGQIYDYPAAGRNYWVSLGYDF